MLEIMHLEEQNPPSTMAKEKHLSYKQSLSFAGSTWEFD